MGLPQRPEPICRIPSKRPSNSFYTKSSHHFASNDMNLSYLKKGSGVQRSAEFNDRLQFLKESRNYSFLFNSEDDDVSNGVTPIQEAAAKKKGLYTSRLISKQGSSESPARCALKASSDLLDSIKKNSAKSGSNSSSTFNGISSCCSAKKTFFRDPAISERSKFLKESRDYSFLFHTDTDVADGSINEDFKDRKSLYINPKQQLGKLSKSETSELRPKSLDSSSSKSSRVVQYTDSSRGFQAAMKAGDKIVSKTNKRLEFLKEARDYSFLFGNDVDAANNAKEYTMKNTTSSDIDSTKLKRSFVPKVSLVSGSCSSAKTNPKVEILAPASTPSELITGANLKSPSKKLMNTHIEKGLPLKSPSKKLMNTHIKKGLPPKLKPTQGSMAQKHPELPPTRCDNGVGLRQHAIPPKPSSSKQVIKRKSEEIFQDEAAEDVSGIIRKMFRYDPRKYADLDDDEDDGNMEVGFRTIQMEEKRSARMAREEDARELALIIEEERLERASARKKQKKQTLEYC